PEIASRKHVENIDGVIKKALDDAGMKLADVDAIGVTYGPGLVGALLVGLAEAKALAYAADKPLIGVHHIEGHICANYIQNKDFEPPYMALVVSGGHSHLVYVSDYGKYEILGRTRDDAAGEAYDKVARAIGMGYPGGPKIDAAAKLGNPDAVKFPRVFLEEDSYDFSFSGLKSAVLNHVNKQKMMGEEIVPEDIAASFQQSVVEVLVGKTVKAAKANGVTKIALAGGVASNSTLRAKMQEACEKEGFTLSIPSPILCTDNAAMIGCAAYYEYLAGVRDGLDLNANPSLRLGDR
ncbi:MAG: tRNA (adenosine(37)-N6)-threonylcarbamoyltransferase complex transferase subunit TsaD, partial [Anaerotignum sp.]|nr:tRNA (adenosine(37)-N6)-threonylcarbamoyltransferase complex transferase subunit TsaD [Anaerotignum sp.]